MEIQVAIDTPMPATLALGNYLGKVKAVYLGRRQIGTGHSFRLERDPAVGLVLACTLSVDGDVNYWKVWKGLPVAKVSLDGMACWNL